jgi:hypothetical protein
MPVMRNLAPDDGGISDLGLDSADIGRPEQSVLNTCSACYSKITLMNGARRLRDMTDGSKGVELVLIAVDSRTASHPHDS